MTISSRRDLAIPVRVGVTNVKTVLGAERKIREYAVNLRWYGSEVSISEDWAYYMNVCVDAVALSTGESATEILARMAASIDSSFAYQQALSKRHGEERLMRFAEASMRCACGRVYAPNGQCGLRRS